jgi:hypothetical protein
MRRTVATLATTLAALALPAAASAAVGQLNGSPLDVYSDAFGSIQVRFDPQDTTPGEFFSPGSNPGNAGLHLLLPGQGELTPTGTVSGPTVVPGGGGTQSLQSTYTEALPDGTNPGITVSENLTYANGSHDVHVHYGLTNSTGAQLTINAGELSDLYGGGDDRGTGTFQPGPPRFVGGISPGGSVTGLREVTPWSRYQESFYGDVFNNFDNAGLSNTIDPTLVDNGVGAEWDGIAIAPGATAGIDVTWHFDTPAAPVPPILGVTFNATPTSGTVRVKQPGSHKYVRLTIGASLPLGTLVDTTHGRINLQSASNAHGGTQIASFYQGIFKVGQKRARKPVTNLTLAGPKPQCGKAKKASTSDAQIARRRSRHLWGSGHGRFRTTGQFSSATVRGTQWLTQDSCQGTLVKVKKGVVAVKDFTRHKTFIVRAGHSHLAPRR